MQSVQNKRIEIDGHSINTLQAGKSSSPAILLLHGKSFQAETWRELGTLGKIAGEDLFVVALDFPGYGKSTQAPLSSERVINGVMEAAGIDKAILVAPSMGGKIGLEYSLEHPEKILGLVLIGSVGIRENRQRLSKLPSSTLIIWGENDQISDPSNGALLHESIPGSQLVIFAGAKHPCYLEQPQLFHKTLLNFAKTIVPKI
ncbi:MAG: alpha/beta hydrolase [Proteobacteria bacterium]|nr:alpha/beta hydrolase [Pseudomonadota bacterium]MBU1060862.1 alpha/beta hydrolase [Pseudomonadota bacterium]